MNRYLKLGQSPKRMITTACENVLILGSRTLNLFLLFEINDKNFLSLIIISHPNWVVNFIKMCFFSPSIRYAIKKDTTEPDKPKYVVLFQGKDLEQVNKAFKEYSFDKTSAPNPKRFSLKRLQELNREVKAQTQSQNKDKNRDRKRENMRGAI